MAPVSSVSQPMIVGSPWEDSWGKFTPRCCRPCRFGSTLGVNMGPWIIVSFALSRTPFFRKAGTGLNDSMSRRTILGALGSVSVYWVYISYT